MSGLRWLLSNREQVAQIVEGMADSIEKKFVLRETKLSGEQVAKVIVEALRETAEEIAR